MLGIHGVFTSDSAIHDEDKTVIIIPEEMHHLCMRGDLHTLKKVCRYASVVMLAGEIAFALLTAATVVFGIWSFSDAGIRSVFSGLIKCGPSDLSLASGTAETAVMFVTMFITVKVIHDIMVSIQREHSPFMEENSGGFKLVSVTFLIAAAPLTVLEYLTRGDDVLTVCVPLICILISVVMYCLTIIFRYGYALQDESDRTL